MLLRRHGVVTLLVSVVNTGAVFLNLLVQTLLANYFGVGNHLDAYIAAQSVPLFAVGVLMNVVNFVAVPALTKYRATKTREEFRSLASGLVAVCVVSSGVLCVVGMVSSHWIVSTLLNDLEPSVAATTTRLMRVLWIAVPAMVIGSLFGSLFHSRRRFLLPTVMTVAPGVSSLILLPLFAQSRGIDAAAFAYVGGCVGSCVLLGVGALLSGDVRFEFGWDPALVGLLGTTVAILIELTPPTLVPIINGMFAVAHGEGAITTLRFGLNFAIFLNAVIGFGIATTHYPLLASAYATRQRDELRRIISLLTRLTLLFTAPVAIMLAIMAHPMIALLFERGEFDAAATHRVANVTVWYLLGGAANVPASVLTRVLLTTGRARRAAAHSVAMLAVFVGSGFVLVGMFSYGGMAIAFCVAWGVRFLLDGGFVWIDTGGYSPRRAVGFSLKLAVNVALMSGVVFGVSRALPSEIHPFFALLIGGTSGSAAFLLTARFLVPMREVTMILERLNVRRALPSESDG